MTSLSGLQAFVETARSGSFVGAGETLGISASAISKAVRRLEEKLGVKLLHRTTRSLSLTGEGEALVEQAGRLLGELHDLAEGVQGSRLRGTLRLTAPHVLGECALIEPVAAFLTDHPQLRLEMRFDNRVADLADEAIDVAVRTGELKDDAHLIVTRFFEYERLLCASPDYLRRIGGLRSLADLEKNPVLQFLMPNRRPLAWNLTVEDEVEARQFRGAHAFEDLLGMARAAAAGLGVAMLPTWACLELLEQGRLVEVLPEHRAPRKPVWLAYHDRRHVSPKVLRFVERMKRAGAELTTRYCPPAHVYGYGYA